MEPVLVVLVSPSSECIHCEALMKIWHKVTSSLLSTYPKLKFPVAAVDTKHHRYPPIMIKNQQVDPQYPKDLNNYCGQVWSWSPMTLLIPGESWHKALKENVKLENVQIMNAKMINNVLKPFPEWNTKIPENFGLWLKATLPKVQTPIKFFSSIIEKINNPIITNIENDVCENGWNIISR